MFQAGGGGGSLGSMIYEPNFAKAVVIVNVEQIVAPQGRHEAAINPATQSIEQMIPI